MVSQVTADHSTLHQKKSYSIQKDQHDLYGLTQRIFLANRKLNAPQKELDREMVYKTADDKLANLRVHMAV